MLLDETYVLNNQVSIPKIGLDFGQTEASKVRALGTKAVKLGWRLMWVTPTVGTAVAVGNLVRRSKLPRTDFFLASTISTSLSTFAAASESIQFSLDALGEFIDLMILAATGPFDPGDVEEIWRTLEDAVAKGQIRTLGLWNFSIPEIERLRDNIKVAPQVLLVDYEPGSISQELVDFSQAARLRLMGLYMEEEARLASEDGTAAPEAAARYALDLGMIPLICPNTQAELEQAASL